MPQPGDIPRFVGAFDRAIAKLADQRYKRLAKGIPAQEQARQVHRALESLQKLQEPTGIPDYGDDWVALFYLLWYQPKQIHLAYTVLAHQLQKRPDRKQPLHIVDFGCGAHATRFALALALADTHRRTDDHVDTLIQGIDPSVPMTKIGDELWTEVRRIVI